MRQDQKIKSEMNEGMTDSPFYSVENYVVEWGNELVFRPEKKPIIEGISVSPKNGVKIKREVRMKERKNESMTDPPF